MSDPKKPSIPSWQLSYKKESPSPIEAEGTSTPTPIDPETGTPASAGASTPGNGGATTVNDPKILLESAEKFLQDEGIRNKPVEEKRAFLESKGVKKEDIARLLDQEGTGDMQKCEAEEAEGKVILDTTSSQSTLQPRSQQTPPATSQSPTQPNTVAPPIVTYPEFLTQPTEKAPLVTVSRLVNTAYLFGGLSATIYGLSKFLVAPMVDSLTVARHEFAENTYSRLDELNEKLAAMVSVDPASKRDRSVVSETAVDSDDDSVDSDPTELYHRDYGTQTSPFISRRPSTSQPTGIDALPTEVRTAASHTDRLKIMTSHMRDLHTANKANVDSEDGLKKELAALQDYLSKMRFQVPYSLGADGYTPVSIPTGREKDEAVEDVRASIRGVKGVLLAARNFPVAGVGGRR